MISEPYEIARSNVQDGVEDCTLSAEYTGKQYGGGFMVSTATYDDRTWRWSENSDPTSFTLATEPINAVLHVNADEGNTPMVVVEGGYEWVPVYSRKLV